MCFDTEKTQAPIDHEVLRKRNWETGQVTSAPQRQMTNTEILAELFGYHPPTEFTLPKFAAINQAAKNFAEIVLQNCPASADRSDAIRKIREARMVANAAVALNGLSL